MSNGTRPGGIVDPSRDSYVIITSADFAGLSREIQGEFPSPLTAVDGSGDMILHVPSYLSEAGYTELRRMRAEYNQASVRELTRVFQERKWTPTPTGPEI